MVSGSMFLPVRPGMFVNADRQIHIFSNGFEVLIKTLLSRFVVVTGQLEAMRPRLHFLAHRVRCIASAVELLRFRPYTFHTTCSDLNHFTDNAFMFFVRQCR